MEMLSTVKEKEFPLISFFILSEWFKANKRAQISYQTSLTNQIKNRIGSWAMGIILVGRLRKRRLTKKILLPILRVKWFYAFSREKSKSSITNLIFNKERCSSVNIQKKNNVLVWTDKAEKPLLVRWRTVRLIAVERFLAALLELSSGVELKRVLVLVKHVLPSRKLDDRFPSGCFEKVKRAVECPSPEQNPS